MLNILQLQQNSLKYNKNFGDLRIIPPRLGDDVVTVECCIVCGVWTFFFSDFLLTLHIKHQFWLDTCEGKVD